MQIRNFGRVTNSFWSCCLGLPEIGTGSSVQWYWEDDDTFGSGFVKKEYEEIEASANERGGKSRETNAGSVGNRAGSGKMQKITWEMVKGKKPDDLPDDYVKHSLISYRKQFSDLDEKERETLPITRDEYDGILKQESPLSEDEKPNPDEHKSAKPTSVANSINVLQSIVMCLVLCVFTIVFSYYLFPVK